MTRTVLIVLIFVLTSFSCSENVNREVNLELWNELTKNLIKDKCHCKGQNKCYSLIQLIEENSLRTRLIKDLNLNHLEFTELYFLEKAKEGRNNYSCYVWTQEEKEIISYRYDIDNDTLYSKMVNPELDKYNQYGSLFELKNDYSFATCEYELEETYVTQSIYFSIIEKSNDDLNIEVRRISLH